MSQILVIGGGVIGCATALALARRGLSVCVLERTVPGAEASSAAGGLVNVKIKGAPNSPLFRLTVESRRRFYAWGEELRALTGIDIGLRQRGLLRVAFSEEQLQDLHREATWQAETGLEIEKLDEASLRAVEPRIAPAAIGGVFYPKEMRVDPPSLMRALCIAAEKHGAKFRTGSHVQRVLVEGNRVHGVLLQDGTTIEAETVLLAAGSFSTLVEGTGLPQASVRPVRGQIVELNVTSPLNTMLFGPACYVVPRDDGRLVIGSTVEFVGYRPGTTAGAVRDLLTAATRLIPSLEDASMSRTWSGLRPHTRDELPVIGPMGIDGLIVATGHFQYGVTLAPLTAEIVTALVVGEPPPVDIALLSPSRLTNA